MLLHTCETARANGQLSEFIAGGISASVLNAESLAGDLTLLAANKRSAAAQFIYATCMEEMGKAFILLDMLRADCRPNGRLARLCRAFYNHLNKYGYAMTVYTPGTGRMEDALGLYELELIEYWPNRDPESGEPDMVADGSAHREWAIYVDWVEFDGRWFFPPDSSLAKVLAEPLSPGMPSEVEERVNELLGPLLKAETEGLFSAESLQIIHEEFSPHYLSATSDERIRQILKRLEERFAQAGSRVTPQTLSANFMRYPLYAAIFDE
ncbi:MAG: AbiV family abortive infection protein [Acidobacteriia bacterium]|nr:AbiV family abortive infection protein [Terriglobia bacterium]